MWISTIFSFITAKKHNTSFMYVQVFVFVLIHDVGHFPGASKSSDLDGNRRIPGDLPTSDA